MRRLLSAVVVGSIATSPAPGLLAAPRMPRSGSAKDDLPHRHALIDPLLASAKTCVPRAGLLGPDSEPVTLALDVFDGHLVVCAQVITRRDVSVFFDPVSYACWNVDPKTAALSRRSDLARASFRCQDGACAAGSDNHVISYEGTERLTFDDAKHTLAISTLTGASVRSFASPPELAGQEFLREGLTYIDHAIFALTDGGDVVMLDDHGKPFGTAKGVAGVHIFDATHVLVTTNDLHATLVDLASRAQTAIKLPTQLAAEAKRFHDKAYAVDDARKLAVLDPVTLAVKQTLPLAACP